MPLKHQGRRSMQEARYKPNYFLQLEAKIWRFGNKRVARAAPTEKEENARLKRLVADLSLDKEMLKDVIEKSSRAILKTGVGSPYD